MLIHHFKVEEALALLEPAAERWAGIEVDLDPDRVSLLAQLSRGYFFHEEPDRAIGVADRALPAAERLGRPASRSWN